MKRQIDYSLYLVTSSSLIAPGSTIERQVEEGILGGVTLVQHREKDISTKCFVERAKRLSEICKKYGVPFLINDRIDVALAVGADGVHIGQDDMDCALARKILGDDAIIGVSTNNIEEIEKAAADGADYVGIGSIYETNTKDVKDRLIGITGLRKILEHVSKMHCQLGTVAIAGLNSSNIQRVIYLSEANGKRIDGIALVSAIMCSITPRETAKELRNLIATPPCFAQARSSLTTPKDLLSQIPAALQKLKDFTPLIHHLTNAVAKNFSANVTLAAYGSPTMGESYDEVADFAKAPGALVLNIGILENTKTYIHAAQVNNDLARPVILDPVAVGATTARSKVINTLLNYAYYDIIKGNEGEIMNLAGEQGLMRGVDSISQHTLAARITAVHRLAVERRCVVAMSGAVDVISDGNSTYVIKNGNPLLGQITASGCSLGSVMGVTASICQNDKLLAAITATLLYNIASELAVEAKNSCGDLLVQGPGTFIPIFVDKLHQLINETIKGNVDWIERAKLEKAE